MKPLVALAFRSGMLLVVFATIVESPSAFAQYTALNFQGLLTDNGGTAIADGNYDLRFRIQTSGGSTLWGPELQNLPVSNGIFNAMLGSVTPIDLPFDEQYYLSIIVNGADTLKPRTPLTPAPYSFAAKYLDAPATISSNSGPPTLTVENSAPGSPTAAQFTGVVRVSDTLRVNGTARIDQSLQVIGHLSKGSGSFKIDHPLEPLKKYMFHSFVESPDMMNVYNGNVVLDHEGKADVILPDWFEALNKDFRYQLTSIGAPAPELHVASKISDNRFSIAGGEPGIEVSWQVTGVRNDPYARANRIQVEVEKPASEQGTLLHPAAFGARN